MRTTLCQNDHLFAHGRKKTKEIKSSWVVVFSEKRSLSLSPFVLRLCVLAVAAGEKGEGETGEEGKRETGGEKNEREGEREKGKKREIKGERKKSRGKERAMEKEKEQGSK